LLLQDYETAANTDIVKIYYLATYIKLSNFIIDFSYILKWNSTHLPLILFYFSSYDKLDLKPFFTEMNFLIWGHFLTIISEKYLF